MYSLRLLYCVSRVTGERNTHALKSTARDAVEVGVDSWISQSEERVACRRPRRRGVESAPPPHPRRPRRAAAAQPDALEVALPERLVQWRDAGIRGLVGLAEELHAIARARGSPPSNGGGEQKR
mmetsp:Transcript_45794/g.144015  ORF Transcript_45794/g.144015 Transcript_45794/m.144015 type:complete len:124 (+) Transcript_45794:240-611(+)